MDRGQEIEAGRPGVAGLDSVDAVDAAEQMVVIADDLAVVVELGGREIMEVARKPLLERAPEDGEVVRRGQLLVVGEAGGVAIERARHAELVRLARHHVGEIVFRLADRLGDRDRHVIRRTGHDGLDRVLDADRIARLKAELRGLLRSGVRGDRNLGLKRHRAAIELLEQQVERHHLGDRGRMAQSVLVRRIERLAAIGVDDERRKRGRSGNRGDRLADGMDAPAMRVACVIRRMRHRAGDSGNADNDAPRRARWRGKGPNRRSGRPSPDGQASRFESNCYATP